jgi:hypothetical protein
MQRQRQQLLQRRLAENAARRARETYLARLPEEYRAYLEACEIVQGEGSIGLGPWFFVDEEGLGYGESRHRPADYRYYRFGWAVKVLAQVATMDSTHDAAEAYFCPFGGNPFYHVNFGWVRARLGTLWEFSPEMLGVVRRDNQAGIVINHYCGYVPEDWNPDEVVYELGVWGFNA